MHTTRLSAASCLTLSTRTSIEALDETGVIESAEQLTTNAALMRELECASWQLVGAYVRELRKVDH